MQFCFNHDGVVAHYLAGGKAFGSCCKEEAYKIASKQSTYADKNRQEFEFRAPRTKPRKDAAVNL